MYFILMRLHWCKQLVVGRGGPTHQVVDGLPSALWHVLSACIRNVLVLGGRRIGNGSIMAAATCMYSTAPGRFVACIAAACSRSAAQCLPRCQTGILPRGVHQRRAGPRPPLVSCSFIRHPAITGRSQPSCVQEICFVAGGQPAAHRAGGGRVAGWQDGLRGRPAEPALRH